MDRLAQLVYEGARTFQEFDATIEIVVVHLFEYGLFEVLARDQRSQCELPSLYLRSCIVEQRVKQVDVDLLNSSRSKFDPTQYLDKYEVFDSSARTLQSNYILERLTLKRNVGGFPDAFEMEYTPACCDLEFGSDTSHLKQLICNNPYRFGPPSPYKKIVSEPTFYRGKERVGTTKPLLAPKSFRFIKHTLTSMFSPSVATRSDDSLQTEPGFQTGCERTEVELAPAGTARGAPDFARRILNSFQMFSDNPEVLSGAEESDHKAVTPNQLAAYFTAKGHEKDAPSNRHEDAFCPSPPRCLSSIPVLSCERSLPEVWDFYDSHHPTTSTRTKPKASRVLVKVPRLCLDHMITEDTAGQMIGGAVRRRSVRGAVAPLMNE